MLRSLGADLVFRTELTGMIALPQPQPMQPCHYGDSQSDIFVEVEDGGYAIDPQQTAAVVFSLCLPRALVRGYRGWLSRSVLQATIDFGAPVGGPESGTAGLARPSIFSANQTERFNVLPFALRSHSGMIAATLLLLCEFSDLRITCVIRSLPLCYGLAIDPGVRSAGTTHHVPSFCDSSKWRYLICDTSNSNATASSAFEPYH